LAGCGTRTKWGRRNRKATQGDHSVPDSFTVTFTVSTGPTIAAIMVTVLLWLLWKELKDDFKKPPRDRRGPR
jgi:hypothetical protein